MKTSELTGAALDWAVAQCEFDRLQASGEHIKQWVLEDHKTGHRTEPYSSDWALSGPIIEREQIVVINPNFQWYATEYPFLAWVSDEVEPTPGSTYLVAAMRCFVLSKLGPEIELPEELKWK